MGGYIPFAKTKAERLAAGDPRPSLQERYGDHAGHIAVVQRAVEKLLTAQFLLSEDADRLLHQAQQSDVLRPAN